MSFFKNPSVDKKYKSNSGDADPIIQVVIPYRGKLSEIPMPIADRLHEQGFISLKTDQDKEETKGKPKQ